MIDNLKSAVLRRLVGQAPVFNPKYLEFSRHWGFDISACNVAQGQREGVGVILPPVGYVEQSFVTTVLRGRPIVGFTSLR